MTELLELDRWLFQFINGQLQNPVFDFLMPYWRERLFWIPLYLGLAGFVAWRFKGKVLLFLVGVALSVGIADQISSELIKKNVQRLRPCNEPGFQEEVHLLINCGSGYSFTSSHAANHFAVAVFIGLTLGLLYPRLRLLLLLWAGSIAFAQVYVGVHYPFDVFCGAIVGSLVGWAAASLYRRLDKRHIVSP